MKYAAEMGSGASTCSGGGYRHTDINLLLLFQNKENRLNWNGSVTVLLEFFQLSLSVYTAYS
jgi:hypothetical protein